MGLVRRTAHVPYHDGGSPLRLPGEPTLVPPPMACTVPSTLPALSNLTLTRGWAHIRAHRTSLLFSPRKCPPLRVIARVGGQHSPILVPPHCILPTCLPVGM